MWRLRSIHFLDSVHSYLPAGGLLIGTAMLALAVPVGADSKFWDGSTSGNFNNAANWVGGVVPVAGDDLVFQAGISRLLVTNDFSPNRAFNSILFQGSNYFVRGNPLIVSNGVNSINPAGTNHINADVDVRRTQFWNAQGPVATIDVSGDINLNANTLTVRAETGDFIFGGVVSGAGNLVKTNVGTLRMTGTGHNAYSGFTRLDGGVLELNKIGILSVVPLVVTNFIAIPGDFTIGDGNDLVGTDFCRLLTDGQIADNSVVTIRNSGVLDLNDHDDRIGPLRMEGGRVETGTGTLILGGNVTRLTDDNPSLIEGSLSLGGASRTFDVASGPPPGDLQIHAAISSGTSGAFTAGIIKEGGGSLYLAGTNTYNGGTLVNNGQLAVLADRALGATTTLLGQPAGTTVNGNGNLFLSGVQVTNEALTVNGTNPGGAFNAGGSSVWTGDIQLNAATFIGSAATFLLSGAITGTGGFTKINGGTLTLGGTNINTYSGMTIVRDGTLLLDKDSGVMGGAMSGPLVIGENELPENADIVRFLTCCQLPDDTDVTINASGLLDLNDFSQNVRNIILNGGDLDTGTGSILPTENITVNANTNSQATISGRMSVLSNPIINVTGHFLSPDLRIPAQLFGAGGLTKNGVGELALSGANTYTGPTSVNAGTLDVDSSSALGTTANGTIVNSGAVLIVRFGVTVPGEPLSLAGAGQPGFGALHSSFGSNSWAGNITLTADATISVDSLDFLNLSGAITGASDLTKTDTGTLILSGGSASSFGMMNVNAGILLLNKSAANTAGPSFLNIGDGSGTDIVQLVNDNQIADTTPIVIELGARLNLIDKQESTGAIAGPGLIDLGSGTLREGLDNNSSTFTGLIIGSGSLFKLGTGTWALTGDNTYTGSTTVSAGTLTVNGAQPKSAVVVNGTANLMGDGVIGDLTVFGNLRPGNSSGILTCSNVTLAAQADFFVELNGSSPGTGYDRLDVRGTTELGGSTLHLVTSPAFAPAEGEALTLVLNDGSDGIVGTFAGLPNGSLLTAGGLEFRIRYSDIFVNDVLLVVTNTALKLGADPMIETGNGNGEIEPGECNLLRIVLTNKTGSVISGVSASLSTTDSGVTVTQPASTYPNLPANGSRTNNTPFQISTAPALVCGTNINLVLTVSTATNGHFSVPITLHTGARGGTRTFNNNSAAGTAIPDLGTLNIPFNVSGLTSAIHSVELSLHLTHTTDNNLDLSLIGPDGTTVDLSSDNGGTLQDYGISCNGPDRTVFSDGATVLITAATPPFRGVFRPEQPFSAFRGKSGPDANGAWTLRIADDSGGGLGTYFCSTLSIVQAGCESGGGPCDPPCAGCTPRLDIAGGPSNSGQVVLKWSTAAVGYGLVATNSLRNPPNAFAPIGPSPVVVGGKFTVTNSASGPARFYELRKP